MTEFTPVRAKRGKIVHATSLAEPLRTACGRKLVGGGIVMDRVRCRKCCAALFLPVSPVTKPRRHRRGIGS